MTPAHHVAALQAQADCAARTGVFVRPDDERQRRIEAREDLMRDLRLSVLIEGLRARLMRMRGQ